MKGEGGKSEMEAFETVKGSRDALLGINVITEEGRLVSINDAIRDERHFRISKGWSVLERKDLIKNML
jgi:hypothetical protein